MSKKVLEYIQKQEVSKREICERLREIILKTYPEISEEMKWGVPVYDGGKFYLGSVKKGVNLGFSVEGVSEQELTHFTGKGKLMRHIKILSLDEIDERKVVSLLKMVKEH